MNEKLSIVAFVLIATGCGVRGDPIPPGTPAELGRGKPNYRRATEGLKFPVPSPSPEAEPEEEPEADE